LVQWTITFGTRGANWTHKTLYQTSHLTHQGLVYQRQIKSDVLFVSQKYKYKMKESEIETLFDMA